VSHDVDDSCSKAEKSTTTHSKREGWPYEVILQGEFSNEVVENYPNQTKGSVDLEGRTNKMPK
jgi:hypothetical protein